jgi:UDP-N-acetylglucosamine 2-epimerase (non-hydrolysing)
LIKRALFVLGTRPEAIKLAPVINVLREQAQIEVTVCSTGQHESMLRETMATLRIQADIDLEVMTAGQLLPDLTARLLVALDSAYATVDPSIVVVQGDTTTAMAGALVAFYRRIPVAHVEAGLRTGNVYSPFPEEVNRRLISSLTNVHFCPTQAARQNLLREGIDAQTVHVTGNTAIDALLAVVSETSKPPEVATLGGEDLTNERIRGRRLVLVTMHRRESHGGGIASVCEAVRQIAQLPDAIVVFPVHLNPIVREAVLQRLLGVENVCLTAPIEYATFCSLMQKSFLILTDSGGIQEEAPSLGVPVLVLREFTERHEGIAAGNARLTGTEASAIFEAVSELWHDEDTYAAMASASNPYGDGHAATRIALLIEKSLAS